MCINFNAIINRLSVRKAEIVNCAWNSGVAFRTHCRGDITHSTLKGLDRKRSNATVSVKMVGTLWGLLVPSMLVSKIW